MRLPEPIRAQPVPVAAACHGLGRSSEMGIERTLTRGQHDRGLDASRQAGLRIDRSQLAPSWSVLGIPSTPIEGCMSPLKRLDSACGSTTGGVFS